jgi:hypothetical protein
LQTCFGVFPSIASRISVVASAEGGDATGEAADDRSTFLICGEGPGVPQTRKRPSLWRSSRTQQARRLPSHSREFLFDPQPCAKQVEWDVALRSKATAAGCKQVHGDQFVSEPIVCLNAEPIALGSTKVMTKFAIGGSVPRREDSRLLRGQGPFLMISS